MTGGTFPGAPVILHGHNEHLGWAHTVNLPDLVDVYRLEMNPANANEYRFEGKWRALERESAPHRDRHRPVRADDPQGRREAAFTDRCSRPRHGYFAIRYAGAERRVHAVEQWYRMNKARSFDEWKAAMRMQAIPMFNTTYADFDNIYYVYNALLPRRAGLRLQDGSARRSCRAGLDRLSAVRQVAGGAQSAVGLRAELQRDAFRTTTGAGNPRARGLSRLPTASRTP